MLHIFKVAFVIFVHLLVCINTGHTWKKTADKFLKETFEYIYGKTIWVYELNEVQMDFNLKKEGDLNDERLMTGVDQICSGIQLFEPTRRNQQQQTVYKTGIVVACNILNYIKEEAPENVPEGPGDGVDHFRNVAMFLFSFLRGHAEKEMHLMLEDNFRPEITERIQQQDRQDFLQFCRTVINSRWNQEMNLLVPCSMVTNYWLIMFPQQ